MCCPDADEAGDSWMDEGEHRGCRSVLRAGKVSSCCQLEFLLVLLIFFLFVFCKAALVLMLEANIHTRGLYQALCLCIAKKHYNKNN